MPRWLRIRLVLDRVIAACGLLVLWPVLAVIGLLVKRDGGPAFLLVARMGRNFEPFAMWKVRSMRVVTADGRAGGSALTAKDDDRITPIGRRIRSYHFDEIPQLINVVRGEMLLLGPRPEDPSFVDPECARWQRLLTVPPGIAGPTQLVVSDWEREIIADDPDDGAYEQVVLPVKLAIDEWYVRTCSPWRDLEVGIALLKRFLPGNQPTRMRMRVAREVPEALLVTQ